MTPSPTSPAGREPGADPKTPAIHTWHQASLAAARWLRAQGYPDAVPVPGGEDTGVDVRATGALALVRHSDKAIRREHLQRLADTRGKDPSTAMYAFTTSRFELPAVTFADGRRIRLLTFADDGAVVPFDYNASLRSGGVAGSPAGMLPAATDAIIRYLPVGLAVFMLIAAAIQVLGIVAGTGGSWAGALTSLVLGGALLALWVVFRRRQRAAAARRGGRRKS